MRREKFISFIALGLLVSNLIMVFYILKGREQQPAHGMPPPGEGPRAIIIERLHFNNEQAAAYELLIHEHRRAVNASNERILDIKNKLYITLVHPDEHLRDSLTDALAAEQRSIEMVHYHHFEDIHKLCKPDQEKDFEHLAEDFTRLFGPPKHPRPRVR